MSAITTHIVDMSTGAPAAGIPITLERKTHTAGWQVIAEAITDAEGRANDLLSVSEAFLPGHYRLTFETGPYYLLREIESFFPQVTVSFAVRNAMEHYHVPLLLSPFGYSTFRGR